MHIDRIEPLVLAPEKAAQYGNALNTLRRLAAGLSYLNRVVCNAEERVRERLRAKHGEDVQLFIMGNDPDLVECRQDLVECCFHWYSVSLVNFTRAVAAISFEKDKAARTSYQDRVLGNVAPFRDKIAAHFAGTTMNQNDNDAERLTSLIPSVSWLGERFVAGAWGIHLQKGPVTSSSAAIGPWSLTELHGTLCGRYPLMAEFSPPA